MDSYAIESVSCIVYDERSIIELNRVVILDRIDRGNRFMCKIYFEIPEESLLALKTTPERIGETIKMAAAVKLYEIGRLSSGAAARLAGIPRTLFLSRLSEYGVDSFRLSEPDLEGETRLA
jgi:predicted HTH domain antitoxin